jgi:hypothetical protein
VIGSSIKTKFELREGRPVLVRLPELNFIDDGPGKAMIFLAARPVSQYGVPTARRLESATDRPQPEMASASVGPYCRCVSCDCAPNFH